MNCRKYASWVSRKDPLVNAFLDLPTVDLTYILREWYALMALRELIAPSIPQFSHRGEKWLADLDNLYNTLTDYLYKLFIAYIPLSFCRELRHLYSESDSIFVSNPFKHHFSRDESVRIGLHYSPSTIWQSAIRMFNPFNVCWDDNYGGEAWYNIAKTTFSYKTTMPKAVFVDYVVDLEHNSGIFLSKELGMFTILSCADLKDFLSLKRDGSMGEVIVQADSPEILNLIRRGVRFKIPDIDQIKSMSELHKHLYHIKFKDRRERSDYSSIILSAYLYHEGVRCSRTGVLCTYRGRGEYFYDRKSVFELAKEFNGVQFGDEYMEVGEEKHNARYNRGYADKEKRYMDKFNRLKFAT